MTPIRSEHRSSAVRDWSVIVVFLVMIVAPPVGHYLGFSDTDFIKKTEFRNPSPTPSWPTVLEDWKTFPKVTEQFINDHFGFRSLLSTLNSWALMLLGSSGSDLVLLGQSGFMFLNNTLQVEDMRGAARIEDADLDRWIEAMTERSRWLDQRGVKMAVAIIPAKQTVYSEFLPEWAAPIGPSRFDRLMERLQQSDELIVIDTRPAIFEAKKADRSAVYYQKDTHWTQLGAFSAYLQIVDVLKREFPSLEAVTPEQVEIIPDSRKSPGGLKRILNVSWVPDEALGPSVRIKFHSRIRSRDVLDGATWKQRPPGRSGDDMTRPSVDHSTLENAPRVLILRDSFTTALRPFLSETFQDVLYVHHQRNTLDEDLVSFFQPDLVLHILVETALSSVPGFRSKQKQSDHSRTRETDGVGDSQWSRVVENIVFGTKKVSWIEESGFFNSQTTSTVHHRWTNGHGKLVVPVSAERPRFLELSLRDWNNRQAHLRVRVNGATVLDQTIPSGGWKTVIGLEDVVIDDVAVIELESDTFVPSEIRPGAKDDRRLGVCVEGIRLLASTGPSETP